MNKIFARFDSMGLRFMVMGRHMKMCIGTTMMMMSFLKKDQTNNINQKPSICFMFKSQKGQEFFPTPLA
jgi:hypothetical protein